MRPLDEYEAATSPLDGLCSRLHPEVAARPSYIAASFPPSRKLPELAATRARHPYYSYRIYAYPYPVTRNR